MTPVRGQRPLWAEQSPFELKDVLKKRGYKWSDGADGRPRSWYIDVDEAAKADEVEFLRKTIYLRDVDPRMQFLSAMSRFSIGLRNVDFPLFLVLVAGRKHAIYYLPADLQNPGVFKPRKPLSENARRAGWRGFVYDLAGSTGLFVRLR